MVHRHWNSRVLLSPVVYSLTRVMRYSCPWTSVNTIKSALYSLNSHFYCYLRYTLSTLPMLFMLLLFCNPVSQRYFCKFYRHGNFVAVVRCSLRFAGVFYLTLVIHSNTPKGHDVMRLKMIWTVKEQTIFNFFSHFEFTFRTTLNTHRNAHTVSLFHTNTHT